MKKNLNWDYKEFETPTDVKDAWRLIGLKILQKERNGKLGF